MNKNIAFLLDVYRDDFFMKKMDSFLIMMKDIRFYNILISIVILLLLPAFLFFSLVLFKTENLASQANATAFLLILYASLFVGLIQCFSAIYKHLSLKRELTKNLKFDIESILDVIYKEKVLIQNVLDSSFIIKFTIKERNKLNFKEKVVLVKQTIHVLNMANREFSLKLN